MSNPRRYVLSITRQEPNPKYTETDSAMRGYGPVQSEMLDTREVSATITEDEFNIIKQALIKVWS